MSQITRKVTLDDLRGLLESPPRANVAFVEDGAICAAPVRFAFIDGRYWIGTHAGGPNAFPAPDQPVVLLVDDGYLYFELRGVRVTGRTALPDHPPAGLASGGSWLEVIVERDTAWHYGTLRKRQDR